MSTFMRRVKCCLCSSLRTAATVSCCYRSQDEADVHHAVSPCFGRTNRHTRPTRTDKPPSASRLSALRLAEWRRAHTDEEQQLPPVQGRALEVEAAVLQVTFSATKKAQRLAVKHLRQSSLRTRQQPRTGRQKFPGAGQGSSEGRESRGKRRRWEGSPPRTDRGGAGGRTTWLCS